jgi:signal transduction histidine kinase
VANGQRFPDPVDVALPKGTSGIQIDFSALSLSIPQRNQVRYRLEGVDDDWVNPGARRQAFYTNLGAGDFVFRVIASNNDGVWNTKGTALKFSIAPTFVETAWFLILCFGALLALLWAAYHFRLRQVTARLQAASEVRIAERERIARELHDTLLQGFQGLVLRFQAVAERIPAEQPVRPLLDQALERADAALIEGRDRVRQLREVERAGDLAQRLREAAAGLAIGQTACFSMKVEGRVRELHPAVREEMVSIAEEALRNAFRHADAQTIEVALSYRSGHVTLQVSDDGKGIPADILSSGKRSGHFGLVGMRERAARSGGTLAFANLPAGGAQVLLTIPAGTAYLTRRSWRPRFWSRFTTPAKVSPHAR